MPVYLFVPSKRRKNVISLFRFNTASVLKYNNNNITYNKKIKIIITPVRTVVGRG